MALLAWIGYIHLHLWQEGYRQIPTDGPLFLLDAVASFVLAAALLTWPRALAGLLAAGYTAATLGALLISLTVGLFGFRESISASPASPSPSTATAQLRAAVRPWRHRAMGKWPRALPRRPVTQRLVTQSRRTRPLIAM